MFDVTFNLTSEEAAFVLRVIGQLPTESNAWPVQQKMVKQFNEQAEAHQKANPAPAEPAQA